MNEVQSENDVVAGQALAVVPADAVFEKNRPGSAAVIRFGAFRQFRQVVKNQLRDVAVNVIAGNKDGIDVQRLADGALAIFSSVGGNSFNVFIPPAGRPKINRNKRQKQGARENVTLAAG